MFELVQQLFMSVSTFVASLLNVLFSFFNILFQAAADGTQWTADLFGGWI